MATPTVLVPLRSPGEGKTRLAGVLDPVARAGLAGAMLADVVSALTAGGCPRVVVAAGGPAAAGAAAALGVEVVTDPPGVRSLDAAVAAGVGRVAPRDDVLIVMADLPCLTGDDVARLCAEDAEVVLAPTTDGGTGALLRRPAKAMPTAYGPGSAARHAALARSADRQLAIVPTTGFSRDVDTARDLDALAGWPVGPMTRRWLAAARPATASAG